MMFGKHPGAGVNYIPNRHQPPPANQPFIPRTPPPGAAQPPGAPAAGAPGAAPPPGQQYTPNPFAGGPPPGAGGPPPGAGGPPMGGPPMGGGGGSPLAVVSNMSTGNPKRDRRLQEMAQWQNFINNRTAPGQTPLDLSDKYKRARKEFKRYMNSSAGPMSGQIEAEMGGPQQMQQQQLMANALRNRMQTPVQNQRFSGGGGRGLDSLMSVQEV